MRVKKLHLKKFKRFDDLTLDLGDFPRKIIALIGPNGCGKSSVLDAFLARFIVHMGQIGENTQFDRLYFSKYNDQGYASNYHEYININFVEGEFYTVLDNLNRKGIGKTMFSFRSAYRFSSGLNVQQLSAITPITSNDTGASLSNNLDDKITNNYKRLYSYINEFRKNNNLTDNQANEAVIGELNRILLNCLDIQIVDVGDIIAGKGRLYFKTRKEDNIFDFNVLSSGEKECVDMLLDLFLKREYFTETIFLIDEPELHLNTSIQRKLILEIEKLVPDNCQLWISTHSIGFIRAFQNELADKTQIVDFSEDNYAIGTKTIAPINPNRKSWNRIFKTAIDDLTDLIAPKRIIYCEGRFSEKRSNEELGIDAKVFNKIFSDKYADTLFVSSGGNTELDQRADIGLAVLSKVFNSIEIWILKDRDFDSGKFVNEEKRQEFLKLNSERHRVLNRWELENYLFDKEILKRYCDSNSLVFNEQKYDSSITNIVDEDVKEKLGVIKSCCSISFSISAEKFKEVLAEYVGPETRVYKELEASIFFRC